MPLHNSGGANRTTLERVNHDSMLFQFMPREGRRKKYSKKGVRISTLPREDKLDTRIFCIYIKLRADCAQVFPIIVGQ